MDEFVELHYDYAAQQDAESRKMLEEAIEVGNRLKAIPQWDNWRLTTSTGAVRRTARHAHRSLTDPNEIRLFRIYSAENLVNVDHRDRTILRGHIIHANPEDADPFCAVSYCWGSIDISNSRPILVDKDSCINISKSLHEALWTVVDKLGSTSYVDIWADQICINQYDLAERGRQVELMGPIFEGAGLVAVWLGPKSPDSVDMCSVMAKLRSVAWHWKGPAYHLRQLDANSIRSFLAQVGIHEADLHTLNFGCNQLVRNPWFYRLWTFQEIVVARDHVFYHGQDALQLDDLLLIRYFTWSFEYALPEYEARPRKHTDSVLATPSEAPK